MSARVSWIQRIVCALVVTTLTTPALAVCPGDEVLYMALEPVAELLGVRGESRQQFLDRVYPGWQDDQNTLIRPADVAEDASLRILLAASAGLVLERADLIVESRIDYVDRDNRRGERFGHRELARYPLPADAGGEIVVPRSAFREPGALIVALTIRRTDVAAAQAVFVRALPVDIVACPRRIYTHDRFTAIRLNRKAAK